MANHKKQKKALAALNYDLFEPESLKVPAPATIDTKIKEHGIKTHDISVLPNSVYDVQVAHKVDGELPTIQKLYEMFDCYNQMYFKGELPFVRIEYSARMTNAGSYTPALKLIKISKKYHELFPDDLADTLKHEMIHIIHYKHNAAFKAVAKRIGASLKAKSHPLLVRKSKYLYRCPSCKKEYPRNRMLRLASCGECSVGGKYDKKFKLEFVKQP